MKKSLLFRNRGGSFCKICFCICLLLSTFSLYAQNVTIKKVTLELKNTPIIKVLLEIQKQTGVNFAYEKAQLETLKPITISVKQVSLEEALNGVLKDSGFTYKITGNNVAIVRQQDSKQTDVIKVQGRVTDERGDPIPGATVLIQGTTQGVATDFDGHYTIMMRPTDVLRISFVGYKTEVLQLRGKTKLNVVLTPTAENIDEVTVVAFGEQKKESVVSAITTGFPSRWC